MKKQTAVIVAALSLVLCFAVGGTLAWLKDDTDPVVNTFTYGDINITLAETPTSLDTDDNNNTNTYKMVPGNTITKDPKVTVKKGSEACWLFVKVNKANNPDTYLDYSIDSTYWTALDGVENVYYYNGTDLDSILTADKTYSVLTGNTVTVKSTLTKGDMTGIATNYPTLTFTAYAVQKDSNIEDIDTAAEAWAIAQGN